MQECTQEMLEDFSKKHFTFINQIFGDQNIREIIQEVFGEQIEPDMQLQVENWENLEGEPSHHHFIEMPKRQEKWCSAEEGIQNIIEDINDTLCQSYSLLRLFQIPIPEDKRDRQLEMIQLYRSLLATNEFVSEIKKFIQEVKAGILVYENSEGWIDYTDNRNLLRKYKFNTNTIIAQINNVLDEWEQYGYNYFIGDGECNSYNLYLHPKLKPIKPKRPKRQRTGLDTRNILDEDMGINTRARTRSRIHVAGSARKKTKSRSRSRTRVRSNKRLRVAHSRKTTK